MDQIEKRNVGIEEEKRKERKRSFGPWQGWGLPYARERGLHLRESGYGGAIMILQGFLAAKKGYITLKEAPHGESISSRFPVHDISLRVPTSTDYMYFTQK